MKPDIHPVYYNDVHVKCACGASYTIGSTRDSYKLDICSNCHPFYTGKQKLIDTAGRVDKFMARQKVAAQRKAEMAERETKRARLKVETPAEKIVRKIKEQEEAEAVPAPTTPEPEPVNVPVAQKPVVKPPVAKKTVAAGPAKAVAKKPAVKKSAKPVAQKSAAAPAGARPAPKKTKLSAAKKRAAKKDKK